MKKRFIILAALGAALALPFAFANAADYLPKDKANGGNVIVGGSDKYHNLYAAGGTVVVNKEITGDLFVAGGSLSVAGPILGDLFAVAGNVAVASPVAGDVRVAGGNLSLNAPVGGDLLIAGGTVSVAESATVGGDVWIAGGVVSLNSPVAGGAKIAGGEVYINSEVKGALEVRSQDRLVFGPQAKVLGPIAHYSSKEAQVRDGAQVGDIDFRYTEPRRAVVPFAGFGIFLFVKMLALLAAGWVLFRLFGKTSERIVVSAYSNFWANLGIGLVGMIVSPIVFVLLLLTVVGAYLAFAWLALFVLFVLLATVYGVMLLGATIEKWIRKGEITLRWLTVLWGVLAGAVLTFIPFVGWLVMCGFFLASLGTMLRMLKSRLEV